MRPYPKMQWWAASVMVSSSCDELWAEDFCRKQVCRMDSHFFRCATILGHQVAQEMVVFTSFMSNSREVTQRVGLYFSPSFSIIPYKASITQAVGPQIPPQLSLSVPQLGPGLARKPGRCEPAMGIWTNHAKNGWTRANVWNWSFFGQGYRGPPRAMYFFYVITHHFEHGKHVYTCTLVVLPRIFNALQQPTETITRKSDIVFTGSTDPSVFAVSDPITKVDLSRKKCCLFFKHIFFVWKKWPWHIWHIPNMTYLF